MNTWIRVLFAVAVILFVKVPAAEGHKFMRKPFQKHYDLKSVSCYTCHVKGKDKEVVSEFGKTLKKLLNGKDIAARMEAVNGADRSTRKKVEGECSKDLVEVLKKLDKMKTRSGQLYMDAIKTGEIEGAKPKGPNASEKDDKEEEDEA